MTNCYFEDLDLRCDIKKATLEKDYYGYFIKLYIPKTYIPKFFAHDIIPMHESPGVWTISASLNNKTTLRLNGKQSDLYEVSFIDLTDKNVRMYNIRVKAYSKKTRMSKPCRLLSLHLWTN